MKEPIFIAVTLHLRHTQLVSAIDEFPKYKFFAAGEERTSPVSVVMFYVKDLTEVPRSYKVEEVECVTIQINY